MTLREKAAHEPDVFRFVAEHQFPRRPGKGTGCRELSRLWWAVHRRRTATPLEAEGGGSPVGGKGRVVDG